MIRSTPPPRPPHFARVNSCRGTSTAAPSRGPARVPAPPRIVTSTNFIDVSSDMTMPGSTRRLYCTKKAPHRAASAADRAMAASLTAVELTPSDSAVSWPARTARR